MSDSKPLIFYDISSPIQPRSYAPNPSKTRYALSFTRATFRTTFVEIPDIPNVRKSLDCPATRKFADGSDFNTLPILSDPVSGEVIGDSFDIANFLNELVPRGRLFPENSKETGLDYESPHKDSPILIPLSVREGLKHEKYARFNWHVDATFTAHVVLVAYYMPFNPETARATRQIFLNRSGLKSWEDMKVSGKAREDMKAAFKDSLTSLAQLYTINEGGPYLEGEQANYADLIVGGWLNMFFQCMPRDEWKEVSMWHGGVFGRLHDALQENYWECK